MSAERAARRILRACLQGEAEVVLSIPAKLAVKLHAVLPGITADTLAVVNELLPTTGRSRTDVTTGKQSTSAVTPSWITALNDRAAERSNQLP